MTGETESNMPKIILYMLDTIVIGFLNAFSHMKADEICSYNSPERPATLDCLSQKGFFTEI